ncbi:MAG TPA: hypothetical protein VM578_13620 [Candidatus Saccharimonadales bacterium]|nr:hypothetical protein [Candidatus Saccharimonadales bacterium]
MSQSTFRSERAPVFKGPTFLMCPPKLYEVDYVINPWMACNVHRASREQATAQWEELRNALERIAKVLLVEPQPGWPDMVFTANAGLVRDGVVAISRFFHPERQGEELHFRKWFDDLGFTVCDTPAFDAESNAKIESRYPYERRIPVSESDALCFACNAINVSQWILLNQISSDLSRQLESRGYHVAQLRLTEFLKAGGAAKCLALRLSNMDATHSSLAALS